MYNMSAASILELQTWIVYQRIAAECANCLCKYFCPPQNKTRFLANGCDE